MSGWWAMPIDRFASPWALVLLGALPALVGLWVRRRRGGALVFSATHRVGHDAGVRGRLLWLPAALRACALALLIVAIARPQQTLDDSHAVTTGIAIELVVDRSGSMDDPTVLDGRQVRRLDAVKSIVAEFIAGNGAELTGRSGDLIGLIAFGTYADTVCPLVRDYGVLLELLGQVEIPIGQNERGTSIGDALALAAARLKSAEKEIQRGQQRDSSFRIKSKAIILLTDGEDRSSQIAPIDAAGVAADWGIKIYGIGIRGGASGIMGGRRVSLGQEINERELTKVCELTGGRFWAVEQMSDLRGVYAQINELETTEIKVNENTQRRELFVPLAFGVLVLLVVELLLRATWLRRLP